MPLLIFFFFSLFSPYLVSSLLPWCLIAKLQISFLLFLSSHAFRQRDSSPYCRGGHWFYNQKLLLYFTHQCAFLLPQCLSSCNWSCPYDLCQPPFLDDPFIFVATILVLRASGSHVASCSDRTRIEQSYSGNVPKSW